MSICEHWKPISGSGTVTVGPAICPYCKIERLSKALGHISHMRCNPDSQINLITLASAIGLAMKALAGEASYITSCASCGDPFIGLVPSCTCNKATSHSG